MKYIIANWKMNLTLETLTKWVKGISDIKKVLNSDKKVILSPSHIHISLIHELTNETDIELASQDVSTEEDGAHTGDTGILQIKEFCKYSIVGHSERGEDRETVLKKRDLCLKNGITPIVCFVDPELAPEYFKEGVILAWEDPKNISKNGGYSVKDPSEIKSGVENIRSSLPEEAALIYGGSVNRENIGDIAKLDNVDGVLVGHASLDPEHFIDIIGAY
ncbi:triose-phosphate isomerase [Patescibacteria group bacterium]